MAALPLVVTLATNIVVARGAGGRRRRRAAYSAIQSAIVRVRDTHPQSVGHSWVFF
jgi:hypothetical protein